MKETRRPTLIVSVQRALHLMEAVASHPGGAPAKQLARQVGLPLATTYHLLRTLVHEGYLVRTADGAYLLGDRVDSLSGDRRTQDRLARIRETLTSLRDELGVATYLSLYEEGEIRVVDIADGPRTPRVDLSVCLSQAAHATAIGKCVLAQLAPPARRDHLARHPLIGLTPNTITHHGELERRLGSTLAIDREEYLLGTGCAAVPVTDAAGKAVGAVAVSCSPAKLAKIEAFAPHMRAAAARINRALTI
ncbi:helix-turn-helix domain-containing protein [Actinoallomurus purpureus]|uniref:IclR family transcriptional regulator n=1 Tax=Actinoallomurus purpureus TaxID=478114 RepID=UPI002093A2BF|nr:IclR family transcriptional regulator C-terminal domain-containing protein [Actinoallomurus purpureus]MCO6011212.1 helix-turn-helix domain-containing protein [Actinoallomurus purpureus]